MKIGEVLGEIKRRHELRPAVELAELIKFIEGGSGWDQRSRNRAYYQRVRLRILKQRSQKALEIKLQIARKGVVNA